LLKAFCELSNQLATMGDSRNGSTLCNVSARTLRGERGFTHASGSNEKDGATADTIGAASVEIAASLQSDSLELV
jgi:hypothetical protein